MEVISVVIKHKISYFFAVIEFSRAIWEKRVDRTPQKVLTWTTFRNVMNSLYSMWLKYNEIAPRNSKCLSL